MRKEEGESTDVIGCPLYGSPATRPYIEYFLMGNFLRAVWQLIVSVTWIRYQPVDG